MGAATVSLTSLGAVSVRPPMPTPSPPNPVSPMPVVPFRPGSCLSTTSAATCWRATALAPLVNFAEAAEMQIVAGEGIAQQITISRGELRLFNVDGAAQINMGVGTQLDRPLTLRLENDAGGGLVGSGMSWSCSKKVEAEACGSIALVDRVTDEQGKFNWVERWRRGFCRLTKSVPASGSFGQVCRQPGDFESSRRIPLWWRSSNGRRRGTGQPAQRPSEWRDPHPMATVVTLEAQDEYRQPECGQYGLARRRKLLDSKSHSNP